MEELLRHYTVEKKVGCGSFGSIYKGNHLGTNRAVCIKKISRTSNKFQQRDVDREIYAGTKLDHPGVVKFREHFHTDDAEFLVFDFIQGMDLFDLMMKRNMEPMMEEEAQKIFAMLVDALLYVHSQGISHRDLKLENIMIDRNTLTPILIDFGLCEIDNPKKCVECVGSVNYTAPEVARRGNVHDSFLSDVFSLGVVLYGLLFARFPYTSIGRGTLMLDLMQPISWKSTFPAYPVSDCTISLLKRMLAINPVRRISLQEVAEHPWVRDRNPPEMSS